ncbi:MAG TPA: methionyl-tRNA formyltransferase [Polyangia bacterium]
MRIVFFGSPEFAVPALASVAESHEVVAVVTQPDRPAGRGAKLQPPAVKLLATGLGLPVLQPAKLRDGLLARDLASLSPDLFVVVAYGRILPPDLLAVPKLGPWNVHASLLPKFRGAAPIQWSLIRGERETGVAIMRMEEGLDTGPVAALVREPIRADDTAGSLSARLAPLGARLLAETLPRIADGTVELREQDHASATLAPPLTKADGQLDFGQAAHVVAARARGVDPWPGATVLLNGQSTKVFLPAMVDGQGQPGAVLGLRPQGLAIACGTGVIAFSEIQLPGRKRMSAKALLAGHPIPSGTMVSW